MNKEILIKEILSLLNNEDDFYWIYPNNVPFDNKYHISMIQNNCYDKSKLFQVSLKNTSHKTHNTDFIVIPIDEVEQDKLFVNLSLMDLFYIKILCLNEKN